MTSNITQGYNLDNFEASFREFLITEKVAPITLKNYLSDLRHFLGWYSLFLSAQPTQLVMEHNDSPYSFIFSLNESHVRAYKTYLENNKLPVKTINRRLSTVRKFCSLCIRQGWLKENPAKNLSNISTHLNHHAPVSFNVEIQEEHDDSPKDEFTFSPKHLFEYQKTLANLPPAEAQTVAKDIEEFFIIINSSKIV